MDNTGNIRNDTVTPTTTTNTADNNANVTPRNAVRNTRRNPQLVQVNHFPAMNPEEEARNDDATNQQDDADLNIRRRNNVTRRNNRRRILHGNYDLLPSYIEELRIDDDFKLELMSLPDIDFEERFFGFHHPRLDSIHHSHVDLIQSLVITLLHQIVDNSGLEIPNNDMDKQCRLAITALHCLIMIIRCIMIKHEANHTSHTVKQFLQHWNNLPPNEATFSILLYASKAAAFARAAEYRPRVYHSVQSVIEVADKYMHHTKYSRALNLIDQQLSRLIDDTQPTDNTNNALPVNTNNNNRTRWNTEELRNMTDALHPTRDPILDQVNDVVAEDTVRSIEGLISDEQVFSVVKSLESTASEGVDAWNHFHLKKIFMHIDKNSVAANTGQAHRELLSLFKALIKHFVAGTFNNPTLWSLSRIIFIPKPNNINTYRPIAIGSSFYRLIADVILRNVASRAANVFAPIQIGVGVSDGAGIVASTLKSLTNANDDLCILSFDIENAFNTERRGRTAAGVKKYFPQLLKLYQRLYGVEFSSLRTSLGVLAGRSCTGVRQGDPLAMLFYCCSIQDTLASINTKLNEVMGEAAAGALSKLYFQASYADDLNICVPVTFAEEIFKETMTIFEHHNFRLNRTKSTIFLSGRYKDDEDLVNYHFPTTKEHVVFKTKILGVIFGDVADVQQSLAANVAEISRLIALLKHVPAHIAFYLVKFCINAKASYLHRIIKPSITQAEYSTQVDDAIITAIEHMVQSPLPRESRHLLRFPCKFDGVGINAWYSFIPKLQYDLLQHRTVTYLQSRMNIFRDIVSVVRREREHFPNSEIGFNTIGERDYINLTSSTRSHKRYKELHTEFLELLRTRGREDVIIHMANQHYESSGLLFGMSYIRNSFIKDKSFFGEALGYRLKVPLIVVPPPDPTIPPPRPYYHCRFCDTYGRSYNASTTLFEHSMSCRCMSAEVIHRHDATVKAITNYIRDTRGESVEIIKGNSANTNGDRGQICDFIIRKVGRPDVKFDVTYTTTSVDAPQSTNSLSNAPLVSLFTAENDKRAHYQRNDNSPGDVIPLAFLFSGYYLGPSFIAFCNTIEADDDHAQIVYDYAAHNGIKFAKDFHPARRRLISEIIRLSYIFIAKARIHARQQVYQPETMNVLPRPPPPPPLHPNAWYNNPFGHQQFADQMGRN
jgi:hypothetical protein